MRELIRHQGRGSVPAKHVKGREDNEMHALTI
jgi:hypothetical protein